jgi:hypothetical protein
MQAWGQLRVFKGGEYRFCSLSIDGSSLRIDTQLVVNNDGVHAAKSVCANTNLVPGVHSITAEGFKGTRSSLEMKLTYSGPDTGGLSEAVRSVGASRVFFFNSFFVIAPRFSFSAKDFFFPGSRAFLARLSGAGMKGAFFWFFFFELIFWNEGVFRNIVDTLAADT